MLLPRISPSGHKCLLSLLPHTHTASLVAALSISAARHKPPTVKNWIDGKAVESKASKWIDLTNPVCYYHLIPLSSQWMKLDSGHE